MANLIDIVKKGSTNRSVTIRIIDSTDGTPETGVVYNTSGIDLWYRREGATKTSITEADLATPALDDAHADGGFLHIGDGEYRLDLPDAAFATGANHVDVGGTVTGMVVIGGRVRLVDWDVEDGDGTSLTEAGGDGDHLTEAGGTGDQFTALPWNSAWDAEVQSECNDAIVANGLDHLLAASVTGTDVTDNSIIAKLVSKESTADWDDFVNTTESLQALRDRGDSAWITATSVDLNTDALDADALAADAIAEINATVDTALSDIKLDKLVSASSTLSSDLTAGCIFDQVMSIDGIGDYDRTTDSLEAIGYQANLITANTAIESATITAGDTFELVQGSDKDITVSVAVSAIDLSSGSPTVKIGLTKINSNSESSAPGTIDGTINNAGVQGSQSVTFSFPKATTGDMALSDYSNRIKSGSPRVDNAYQYTIVAHDYPSASKCTPIPNGQGYVKVLEADGAGCA